MKKKSELPPVIVVRKVIKKGHGGHHGGSWKVAYADFMTSMLALFIVLWVIGQNEKVRQAVAEYFQNPDLSPKEISLRMEAAEQALKQREMMEKVQVSPSKEADQRRKAMESLKGKLFKALKGLHTTSGAQKQVTIDTTDEGLRISLVDSPRTPFFDIGGAEPKEHTRKVLAAIGRELKQLPNPLILEGHTDSRQYSSGVYTNWELSSDRANSTRRQLLGAGVKARQVVEVRGYADTYLKHLGDPYDARNRRVSIIVKYDPLTGKPPGKLKKVRKAKAEPATRPR